MSTTESQNHDDQRDSDPSLEESGDQYIDFDFDFSLEDVEDIFSMIGTVASGAWLAGTGLSLFSAPLLGFGLFGGIGLAMTCCAVLPPIVTATLGVSMVLRHLKDDERLQSLHSKTEGYQPNDFMLDLCESVRFIGRALKQDESVSKEQSKAIRSSFAAAALGAVALIGVPLLSSVAGFAAVPAFMYAAYNVGKPYLEKRHSISCKALGTHNENDDNASMPQNPTPA
jgi:hypothetical protein